MRCRLKRQTYRLNKTTDQYRSLFYSMNLGVVYQNHHGEIISANPAAEKILGVRLETLIGRASEDGTWNTIHEDGTPFPGELHPAMVSIRTGKPVRDVIMGIYNPVDNQYHWILTSAIPEFLPGQTTPYQVYVTFIDITELKAAQKRAKDSEARLNSLVANMAEGVALHDVIFENGIPVNYRIVDINPAFEKIIHLEKENILNKSATEVFNVEKAPYLTEYSQVALTGKPCQFETYFPPMDKYFQISVAPLTNHGFATLFFDITQNKKAHEELRASEERYRRLVDATPTAILVIQNGEYVYSNPAGVTLFGYDSAEELLQLRLSATIHPDSLPHILQKLEIAENEAANLPMEIKLLRKDGCVLYTESRYVPILFKSKPAGLLISNDITDRKRVEDALQSRVLALTQPIDSENSALRIEDLFDIENLQEIQDAFASATGVASIITDIHGKPVTKPSNFCALCQIIRKTPLGLKNCMASDRVMGTPSEKPIIQHCLSGGLWDSGTSIMVGERHIANWLIGQILDTSEPQSNEIMLAYGEVIGADLDAYKLALSKVPRMPREQFEKISQYLHIIAKQLSLLAIQNIQQARHISEQIKAEAKIQALNATLEQRVQERTLQLEMANKELESFSYSVSHDLRAPLRSMDGFSQALWEDYSDRLDEQAKNYIQRIRMGSQRMASLVDDILKLSRISRSEMHREICDLSVISQQVMTELRSMDSNRMVEFKLPDHLEVYADPHLIQIMLTNLLNNAWKFTSRHESAHIELGTFIQNGETIYFIQDDGAGFDMAYADKIFNAFQRLHSSSDFEGTGIGLAMVHRIVHRHGGQIWAEGYPEKGATFYFSLGDHSARREQ